MERIKTNIIELSKLYKTPCKRWLRRFENGRIDAHEAFKVHGEEYVWLYNLSPYDLIGWEIEHDCFDWENHSWAVAMLCSEHLEPEKYNWMQDSWVVAQYCHEKIDPFRFNWVDNLDDVLEFCPHIIEELPLPIIDLLITILATS